MRSQMTEKAIKQSAAKPEKKTEKKSEKKVAKEVTKKVTKEVAKKAAVKPAGKPEKKLTKKAAEDLAARRQLALKIIERLKEEYPDTDCTLDYDQAWKLLVSVRLAAQCTDARVNVVVEDLYRKFPDVNALAEAPVEEIEKIVHPCGLGTARRGISAPA